MSWWKVYILNFIIFSTHVVVEAIFFLIFRFLFKKSKQIEKKSSRECECEKRKLPSALEACQIHLMNTENLPSISSSSEIVSIIMISIVINFSLSPSMMTTMVVYTHYKSLSLFLIINCMLMSFHNFCFLFFIMISLLPIINHSAGVWIEKNSIASEWTFTLWIFITMKKTETLLSLLNYTLSFIYS